MSLSAKIIRDFQDFSNRTTDFAVPFTLTDKDSNAFSLNCFHTMHHTAFDEYGSKINTRIASIAVSEQSLIDGSVVYRNTDSNVEMTGWLVSVSDSSGTPRQWIVREDFADEKLGCIVLIISTFES